VASLSRCRTPRTHCPLLSIPFASAVDEQRYAFRLERLDVRQVFANRLSHDPEDHGRRRSPCPRARFRRFQVGAKDTPGRLSQTRGTARWTICCALLAGRPAGGKGAPCGDAKSSHYSAAQRRGRSRRGHSSRCQFSDFSAVALRGNPRVCCSFPPGPARGWVCLGSEPPNAFRWADGDYDQLPALAADLVKLRVAVLFAAGGSPSTVAAKTATASIPIVFSAVRDPLVAIAQRICA
jgi:hypothetical protein